MSTDSAHRLSGHTHSPPPVQTSGQRGGEWDAALAPQEPAAHLWKAWVLTHWWRTLGCDKRLTVHPRNAINFLPQAHLPRSLRAPPAACPAPSSLLRWEGLGCWRPALPQSEPQPLHLSGLLGVFAKTTVYSAVYSGCSARAPLPPHTGWAPAGCMQVRAQLAAIIIITF